MEEQLTAGLPASGCGRSSEDMRWPEMCLHLCHQNRGCPSPRHSWAVRSGGCDVEWLCFLPVPEGLPEPAVLLCAEMLGIYLPYLSAGWSQHSLQCVLKTFHRDIPYIYIPTPLFGASSFPLWHSYQPPVESKAMAHEGLLQEEAQERGKTDFKSRVSQKAEIVGSCTEKMKKMKKRKEDLNGSKPAEQYKGEKQCRHETLPAPFHRPGTANLSQEVKQRKGVKWVRARRAHGGRDAFYLWQGQSTELTSACGSVTRARFWVPLERHSRDVDGAGWGNVPWDWQKQLCQLCQGEAGRRASTGCLVCLLQGLPMPPFMQQVNRGNTENKKEKKKKGKREATQCKRWNSYVEDAFLV